MLTPTASKWHLRLGNHGYAMKRSSNASGGRKCLGARIVTTGTILGRRGNSTFGAIEITATTSNPSQTRYWIRTLSGSEISTGTCVVKTHDGRSPPVLLVIGGGRTCTTYQGGEACTTCHHRNHRPPALRGRGALPWYGTNRKKIKKYQKKLTNTIRYAQPPDSPDYNGA